MKMVKACAEGIMEAAEILREGKIVAYPTETVYGLGVDPFSPSALKRLFALKGRDPSKPVLLIIGEWAQLDALTTSVSPRARKYMDHYWPGPLSLLFPRASGVPVELCGDTGMVCVRLTASETAAALCREFDCPVTSTSANRSGAPPARSVDEIDLEGIALAIDGGVTSNDLPSTVFNPETGEILREGAISRQMLESTIPE